MVKKWEELEDELKRLDRRNVHEEQAFHLRVTSHVYQEDCKKKDAEVIVKVVSHLRSQGIPRAMKYVLSDKESGRRMELDDSRQLDANEIDTVLDEWGPDLERKDRKDTRYGTHMVLSAKCEKTAENKHRVESAVRWTLREKYGDEGFRYMFVMHGDTDYLHAHVVINNRNLETGRQLQINTMKLLSLRREFAKQLREMGLQKVATLRRDRDFDKGNMPAKTSKYWEAKLARASKNAEDYEQRRALYVACQRRLGEEGKTMSDQEKTGIQAYKRALMRKDIPKDKIVSKPWDDKAKKRLAKDAQSEAKRHAKDLLVAEMLLKGKEKKDVTQRLGKLATVVDLDIERYKVQQTHQPSNEIDKEFTKRLSKLERSVPGLDRYKDSKSGDAYSKHLQRICREHFELKDMISKTSEKEITQRGLNKLTDQISQHVDVVRIENEYKKAKRLDGDIKQLKEDLKGPYPTLSDDFFERLRHAKQSVESDAWDKKHETQAKIALSRIEKTAKNKGIERDFGRGI